MGIYTGITIRTEIKKHADGKYYTTVWKDGSMLYKVLSSDDSIKRKERKSLLWSVPKKLFNSLRST